MCGGPGNLGRNRGSRPTEPEPWQLVHLNAPMRDRNNIIRFELLPETNAEVARTWLREVWKVVIATPRSPPPPMEDMEVSKTYTNQDEATRAAQQVVHELKAAAGAGAFSAKSTNVAQFPVVFPSAVFSPREHSAQLVMVMYDNGAVTMVNV